MNKYITKSGIEYIEETDSNGKLRLRSHDKKYNIDVVLNFADEPHPEVNEFIRQTLINDYKEKLRGKFKK